MRGSLVPFCLVIATAAIAQEEPPVYVATGMFSVGGRTSVSLFNGGSGNNVGQGTGGQFRIRLGERVNTDWFYDYFRGNIGDVAFRTDQHIGWSVLFYVLDPGARQRLLEPYVLAGHCFDHTRQQVNGGHHAPHERWSSAVQAGAGTHLNLSDRADVSLVGQYMVHLGTDLHVHEAPDGQVVFEEHGAGLEGHLLVHLSFNYKLFRLW